MGYKIQRHNDDTSNVDDRADRIFITAYGRVKDIWFMRKSKKIKLAKDIAWHMADDTQKNLINGNWVCLTKSQKKRDIVDEVWWDIKKSILKINNINWVKDEKFN